MQSSLGLLEGQIWKLEQEASSRSSKQIRGVVKRIQNPLEERNSQCAHTVEPLQFCAWMIKLIENNSLFQAVWPWKSSTFLNHYSLIFRPLSLYFTCKRWVQISALTLIVCTFGNPLAGCQFSALNLLAVIPQPAVGFSGFCICLSTCQKDSLDHGGTNICWCLCHLCL